jgi:RNA polymerase sigma factor (sigma-70 family)
VKERASRILKHKIADYWETHRREQDHLVNIQAQPLVATGSALDSLRDPSQAHPDVAIEVGQILASLPKEHRVLLLLSVREGWTTAQIAAATKLPTGTVGRIIWEAKRSLRAKRINVKKLLKESDQ